MVRSLRQGLCTPHELASSLTRKQYRTRGDPVLDLSEARGHFNWRTGQPALLGGNLGCWILWPPPPPPSLYCRVFGVCHGQDTYGLKVVYCFRHFTASHIHNYSRVERALKTCKRLLSLSCGCVSNMLLVLSITNVIKIYGVVCVQLTHFSSGDWKDIFIAHVIIIIKSEVATFPIVIIFFRGRVSEMFVTS